MPEVFKKLAVAITFSPTSTALLKESARLKKLFDSELLLIHSGHRNEDTEKSLNDLIINAGLDINEINIDWVKGDPGESIIRSAKYHDIDLMVAGALQSENIFKHFVGSVARKIMRESESSVLIFKSPSENPSGFKKFYVSTDFSQLSEMTVKKSFEFAQTENAEEFVLIRDFRLYGLSSSVVETGDVEAFEQLKKKIKYEEEEKLKIFVRELNLKGIKIKTACLYGKEGLAARDYALQNNADIFVVTAPSKKLRLLDRIFPHELEYSFERLPSNLLIIKNT